MIICKIKNNAGPGNQMFMYAFSYALARENGQRVLILSEISGYSVRQNVLQYLNIDRSVIVGFLRTDWTKNQYIYRLVRKVTFDYLLRLPLFHQIEQPAIESRVMVDVSKLDKGKLYVTDGYWECHKYFDFYRDDLINQFKPNYVLSTEVVDMINQVHSCESVAVHIRKGDFQQFGRLVDDSYYIRAIDEMRTRVSDPTFYLITEDEKTRRKFSKDSTFRIVDFNTPHKYIDEWYVMSNCRHHIIANSTYSWWSSYLGNSNHKRVIIPDVMTYLQSEKTNDCQMYKNYFRSTDEALP